MSNIVTFSTLKNKEKISEKKKQESKTDNTNTAIEKPREKKTYTPDKIHELINRPKKERPAKASAERGVSKINISDNISNDSTIANLQIGSNNKELNEKDNLYVESIITKKQINDGESMGVMETTNDTYVNCDRKGIIDGEGVIDEFGVLDEGGTVKREHNTRKNKDETEPEELKKPDEKNIPESRGGSLAGLNIPIKNPKY